MVTSDPAVAAVVTDQILREITRLEAVFSIFDPASEVHRWRRGEVEPGPELVTVLESATRWQHHSSGAFNPAVGALMDVWDAAAAGDAEPDPALLDEIVSRIAQPGYRVTDSGVVVTGDLDDLDLNAIAKGWIVDRAMDRVDVPGVSSVVVNAGGDMLHRGTEPIEAGIENPHRPYDNEPPLTTIRLRDGAIATSGLSRRGWTIDGRWFGHVVDPRHGYPVDRIASASVVAPDAATADVVATILTVMAPDEALPYAEGIDGIEAFLVLHDRSVLHTTGWPSTRVS